MIFLITSGPEFFMGIPSEQVCFQEISLSHLNEYTFLRGNFAKTRSLAVVNVDNNVIRMDGRMDDAILRHFQHRGDESILTKGYVQWNPVYV